MNIAALIVIDVQKGFDDEDWVLHELPSVRRRTERGARREYGRQPLA
jgi:nicotinamidase-related amidase